MINGDWNMKQFEYRVEIYLISKEDYNRRYELIKIIESMNKMGKDGWETIDTNFQPIYTESRSILFRREIVRTEYIRPKLIICPNENVGIIDIDKAIEIENSKYE